MNLKRPLVIFDLETTGPNVATDRIVEIALVTLEPNRNVTTWVQRINPEVPIPPSATKIHGITDADVATQPTFAQVVEQIEDRVFGRDLGGFNVARFDLPLLRSEFKRVGWALNTDGAAIVDVMRLFHTKEPRDLSGAVNFYLGAPHNGAHGALADAEATLQVLVAQSIRYSLEGDAEAIAALTVDPDAVDDDGKFKLVDGRVVFTFGKHKGRRLDEVARTAPDFLGWMLRSDFTDSTKRVVRAALTPMALEVMVAER